MFQMHTATPRTRLRVAATLAATTLALGALSACGSDDGEDKAESPRSTESSQAQGGTTQAASQGLLVEDPWVRATKGSKDTSMTAAFMVLSNETDEEVTLTGASTDVAGMTQIHDMTEIDGVMSMVEIKGGLKIAPQTGAILQPGGKHVMLMDMKSELAPGDEVTFTLTLDNGKTVEVTAPVKAAAEEEGHYHAPGTGEHTH